ncbi:hypothetical protein K4K54_001329 [Colletotrichum sp. SAR 10_86]|nr:hypothetical protein CGCSCA1_v003599 [Colletotrichum siamense]KAI8188789.1 hypothetical protein K4K51_006103 [Colletotrichum sp. SAR 10_75]KAI8237000.1 hypothetical protein K4K54_001329 [Colletotrichum sp. SAR 10_86]
MPPKKNTEAEGSATALSETETRFLKAMFDHMNSRPDIDWDKVATDLGMTAKSAKERFRVLGKRHNWGTSAASAGGGNGSPAKGPLAPKNASKVAKKATPQKKGIARKKTKKDIEESDGDEDISSKLESDSDGKSAAHDEFMKNGNGSDSE